MMGTHPFYFEVQISGGRTYALAATAAFADWCVLRNAEAHETAGAQICETAPIGHAWCDDADDARLSVPLEGAGR